MKQDASAVGTRAGWRKNWQVPIVCLLLKFLFSYYDAPCFASENQGCSALLGCVRQQGPSLRPTTGKSCKAVPDGAKNSKICSIDAVADNCGILAMLFAGTVLNTQNTSSHMLRVFRI